MESERKPEIVSVQPTYIDEAVLKRAVEEQGPKQQAGMIAREEGIEFNTVRSLRLDYMRILEIDSLWAFTSLIRLQLNNNQIQVMRGLDALVNLRWLDLSFNFIERIEGLEKLHKIEDLSLFYNKIELIENMDSLNKSLQCLSLGHNKIHNIDDLMYLRRFRRLQMLTLHDNPICKVEAYAEYMAAFLPNIVYLDNVPFMSDDLARRAHDLYYVKVSMEREMDEKEQTRKEAKKEAAKLREWHADAFVADMDGPLLFEQLYEKDPEGEMLNQFIEVSKSKDEFKQTFVGLCRRLFDFGLVKRQERDEEVSMMMQCFSDSSQVNRTLAIKEVDQILAYRKALLKKIQKSPQPLSKSLQDEIRKFGVTLKHTANNLLSREMHLVTQLEDNISQFSLNVTECLSSFMEVARQQLALMRDAENKHHMNNINHIATIQDYYKDDPHIDKAFRLILVDKELLSGVMQTSHDYHLLVIDQTDDQISKQVNRWKANMFHGLHEREVSRNREHILELLNFIDWYRISLPVASEATEQLDKTKLRKKNKKNKK